MLAARAGQVEVVRLLLANGADINAQDDLYGRTVLMWAARGGDVEGSAPFARQWGRHKRPR